LVLFSKKNLFLHGGAANSVASRTAFLPNNTPAYLPRGLDGA
jgi:hypothetical protein